MITVLFSLLVVGALAFGLVKAAKYGFEYYNTYWKDNNISYWYDLNFFDEKNINPQKRKTDDEELRSSALTLMRSCIEHDKQKRLDSQISISDKYYNMLCPGNSLDKAQYSWSDLSSFLVLQNGSRAIVLYEFTVVPTDLEKAEMNALNSYKPRLCNRLYLEKKNGVWTAHDVLVVQ